MRSTTGAKGGISGDGAHASLSQEVLKVKEHTKHTATVNYASVSPHTKDVQLKEQLLKKNAVSFLMKLRSLGEGKIGTVQATSVVSGEGQVQRHCSQSQPRW